MTDNVAITPGTGATVATDDVGGVHYQITKLAFGALDTATLVAPGSGLPVAVQGTVTTGGLTDTQLRATALPVSGTVTANLGTVAGLALDASVTALSAKFGALGQGLMAASTPVVIASNQSAIPVTLASTTVTGSVAVTGPLTDTQIRATALPVSNASLPLPTGASTSALQTTGNSSLSSMDGKTPALGQALAAASTPVVLTAAQVTTLTPPAAITGFSTETTLAALNAKVTAVNTGAVVLAAGAAAIGSVTATGNIAQGVADTGNPVEIGGHASLLLPYTVTDGQRVRAWYGNYGNASVSLVAFDGAHMSQNGLINDTSGNSQNRLSTQAFPMLYNGATWDRQRGDATSGAFVQVKAALPTGANVIGALTANQSVNNAQIGGVAVAVGSGVTGTGVQRMVLATDVGLPAGANVIGKAAITNGTVDAGVEPFGAMAVNAGFQTLFYDEWPTNPIDTVDKWTVTGTTPVVATGNMTMVATLSTYNAIQTKDTVRPNVGFSLVRNGFSIEAAVSTGAGRFWGLGTPATVPAAAVLAQNGIGFELDQATGSLLAVTYAAGVRTTIATLTRPTDGLTHAYGVYFRVTQAYWILDGVTVASQSFPNIQVAALPALIVRQNAAAFTGTPAFVNIAHLTADTSRQGVLISDPIIGTRQARVTSTGSLHVNNTHIGGTAIAAGTGISGAGVQRVTLATDIPLPTAAPSTTYSASIVGLATALTATDIFTITGSATRTVRVTRFMVNGVQTTAAQVNVLIIKRSTANTAGTSTAPTRVAYDSTNAAATATVLAYTANPTLGTAVGTASASRAFIPGAATASDAQGLEIVSGDVGQQSMTLRGIAEVLAVNLNATTVTGAAINVTVEWTEALS